MHDVSVYLPNYRMLSPGVFNFGIFTEWRGFLTEPWAVVLPSLHRLCSSTEADRPRIVKNAPNCSLALQDLSVRGELFQSSSQRSSLRIFLPTVMPHQPTFPK
jgi:hypothetical protein